MIHNMKVIYMTGTLATHIILSTSEFRKTFMIAKIDCERYSFAGFFIRLALSQVEKRPDCFRIQKNRIHNFRGKGFTLKTIGF